MSPMILTIQTASPAAGIAITAGGKLLAELNLDVHKTPTEWLLESVDLMLT